VIVEKWKLSLRVPDCFLYPLIMAVESEDWELWSGERVAP